MATDQATISIDPIRVPHVALHVRVGLLFKLFSVITSRAAEEATSIQIQRPELEVEKAVLNVLQTFERVSADAFSVSHSSEPIDRIIAATLTSIEADLRQIPDTVGATAIRVGIGNALAKLREVDCSECSKKSGLTFVCTGDTEQDSRLVSKVGLCFRWLLDLTEYIAEATKRYYGPSLAQLNLPVPVVLFSTGLRKGARPHGLDHPSHVSARTAYAETTHPASDIRLFLTDRFDKESWLCIYYVLHHEYICHAYQAMIFPAASARTRPPDCRFTEGWMDSVAHRLARLHFEGPPSTFPAQWLPFRDECLASTHRLYDARYAADAPDRPRKRLTGVRAFERVAVCFWFNDADVSKSRDEPMLSAVGFSFLLNIIAKEDELEEVTTLILKLLPFDVAVPGYNSRSRSAWREFDRFIKQPDCRALISGLSRLVDDLQAA